MATKKARNKAVHKAVQSTRKENKSQGQQVKRKRREDFSQAAARIVREATEGH
jgi:hypothetical protein